MVAEVARYLHQSINEIGRWKIDKLFDYHAQIASILEAEQSRKR